MNESDWTSDNSHQRTDRKVLPPWLKGYFFWRLLHSNLHTAKSCSKECNLTSAGRPEKWALCALKDYKGTGADPSPFLLSLQTLLFVSHFWIRPRRRRLCSKLSVTHTLGQKTFLKSIQKHTSAHTEIAIVVVHECANSECTKSNMNTKFKSGHSWDKPEIFKCCLSEESF